MMFVRQSSLFVAACFALFAPSVANATPIPGAVVWFDANDVDGDGNSGNNPAINAPVATWADKATTVQGAQNATNGTVAQRPLFVNYTNGQKGLNFNGTQLLITNNVSLGAMTYFAAFRSTGASAIIAERGANINNAGVYGEFLTTVTNHSWRAKRVGGDSGTNYVTNWGNTNTPMTAAFRFDGTAAGQTMHVNGAPVALTGASASDTNPIAAQLFVGARTGATVGFVGQIAELMVYDTALNTAQINIVDNYLSSKYDTTQAVAQDFYNGDTNAKGNYDFQVFGIGAEADGAVNTGTYGNGLTLTQANSSLSSGEYLLAGIQVRTNNLVSNDVALVDATERLQQVWYLDKTGALDATLTFNLNELNQTLLAGQTASLLYRSGLTGEFADLNVLASLTPVYGGNQVSFLVPNAFLLVGYYTLGITSVAPEPSSCGLLGLGLVMLITRRRRKAE